MKIPRFRLAWLMVAVALIAVNLAVICVDLTVLGLDGLEVGLLPGVTALTVVLFAISGRPGGSRPFAWGFVASLTMAMCAYVICCLTIPDLLRWSMIYHVDAIVRHFYAADPLLIFRLSLAAQGLMLGLPQLALAVLGGLLSRRYKVTITRR